MRCIIASAVCCRILVPEPNRLLKQHLRDQVVLPGHFASNAKELRHAGVVPFERPI
jgi:hypothetical protein